MNTADLRIALVTGNYNYVRDGANQALNRLVEYLLRQGAQVQVLAPASLRSAVRQRLAAALVAYDNPLPA